mgnify:CR=1 FL=1|jgi:hypothetical protein
MQRQSEFATPTSNCQNRDNPLRETGLSQKIQKQEGTQTNAVTMNKTGGKNYLIKRASLNNGFALPVVIIIGLFLGISGLTLAAQIFQSLVTSRKTNFHKQSLDIAETGLAEITSQLNSRYRYLLINCYRNNDAITFDSQSSCNNANIGGWNQDGSPIPTISGAACLGSENEQPRTKENYSDGIILQGTIDLEPEDNDGKALVGEWTLESYTFYGNQLTGGKGLIKVQGKRINTRGEIMATTTIKKTMLIKSKPCGRTLLQTHDPKHLPGLIARSINLNKDDVIGSHSANIFCTGCENFDDINQHGDSVVDGSIFTGSVILPDVPTFPSELKQAVSMGDITPQANESVRIESPDEPLTAFDPLCEGCEGRSHIRPAEGKPMCVTDMKKRVHCLFNNISLQGTENVIIDTAGGNRPVFIYLKGNLSTSNHANLINQDGESSDLVVIGDTSCQVNTNQNITLSGANTLKGFIYAPCASVTIINNPNDNNNAECLINMRRAADFDNQSEEQVSRDCLKGDLDGAAWVGNWNSDVENASAEITVPSSLSTQLTNQFGSSFTAGPSDFVAVGTIDWEITR